MVPILLVLISQGDDEPLVIGGDDHLEPPAAPQRRAFASAE
jgi:hypothetical protein